MPVLGHAFAGLAIGVSISPSARERGGPPSIAARSGLWLPALVTLAYFPDIVAELGHIAGWSDSRLLGHSLLFAGAVSPVIAAALTRLVPVPFPRAFATALLSLLVHDVLDLAGATDRAPWWPLSDRPVGVDLGLIPSDLPREAAVFGGLLLAFLALRHAAQRWAGRSATSPPDPGQDHGRWVWLGRAYLVTVVLAAAVTHSLRGAREAQFDLGRELVEHGAYQAGLEALARAEPWPSTTKPGRIDHARAEAYAGMGDRQRAEAYYLRAYRADRSYVWVVAGLALFYASSPEPVAERRRLAAPYINRLRAEFAGEPALPEILERVERKLAAAPCPDAPVPAGAPPGGRGARLRSARPSRETGLASLSLPCPPPQAYGDTGALKA